MHYDDFVLQIEAGLEAGFEVRVLQSPAGEGRAPLQLDIDRDALDDLLPDLTRQAGQQRDAGTGSREIVRRYGTPQYDPREVGAALFRGIFSGQTGQLFERSLGGLATDQNRGLRIKLKLNGDDPRIAHLAALPWELIRRSETDDFFGLDRRTPLVRYLDVPRPRPRIPLPSVLRVLVVAAAPKELDALKLSDELQQLRKEWKTYRRVEVDVIEHASLTQVREALSEKDFHVLHFMGHGGFDRQSGEGVLYFESTGGGAVPVSGRSLAVKLKGHPTLGLVFLNACNSGRTSALGDAQPFAGVATALVYGGMPAVLAMQFPISDSAAIRFSQTFYRHLAAGVSVDGAVTEGRQAIHTDDPKNVEWATPVLFIRTADSRVFHRSPRKWVPGAVAAALVFLGLMLTVLLQPTLRSYVLPVSYALETTWTETTVEGVQIQLSRVEMRDDGSMRLYYQVINDTQQTQPVGLDLEQAYLADEFGNKYEILAAKRPPVQGQSLDSSVAVLENVAPGERLESWIELPAPLDGAQKLAVNLAVQDQSVAFPWLEVDLPNYPRRLGRVTPAYDAPPGSAILSLAQDVDLGVEALQSHLTRVEMLSAQRMRWNLDMLNTSTEALGVDLDTERSYLMDENGRRYGVMDYDRSANGEALWTVAGALRAERWLEFPSPLDGARSFRVVLYSKHGEQPLTNLEVDLPEYDVGFSQTLTAPGLGLLPAPVDLEDNMEGLNSRLLGVDSLKDGSQRWHVELHNASPEPLTVGFSYPRSYVADGFGRRYTVKAAENTTDVRGKALKKVLAVGERSFHFFDFEAPMLTPGSWWLVLVGHDAALRWQPAAVGQLSFPKSSFRRRPGLAPPSETAFEMSVGVALKPCLAEVSCRLEAVFLGPSSMRWRFHFLNRGAEPKNLAFHLPGVSLLDEHGNVYRAIGAGSERSFSGRLEPRLAADLWLDFGSPVDGSYSFEADLASGLSIDPFVVPFPSYPAELSIPAQPSESEDSLIESEIPLTQEAGEGFKLLGGEALIETDLEGFRAKLLNLERFDDMSRLTIEVWNGSGEMVQYGFDLHRTQLFDGVMSSPSRVLRADSNANPRTVQKQVVRSLPPGGRARHWFEFVGPRAEATTCFVALETYSDSQVQFSLLEVQLKD